MHAKARVLLVLTLVLAILVVGSWGATSGARAVTAAQDALPLSGYRIYFTEDNSEASRFDRSGEGLSRLGGLLQGLGAELLTLEWRSKIPADADLIIMAGPMWNLSHWRIARLWVYLNSGGSLLLLGDVNGSADAPGLPASSGIFELLWIDAGLRGRDDIVVKQSGAQDEPASAGEAGAQPPLNASATFSVTSFNPSHPITKDLEGELAFSVARSLEISGTSAPYQVSSLVYSDSDCYGETTLPVNPQDETFAYSYDPLTDTAAGAFSLAVAVESLDTKSRIVIIGDREFASNGMGLQTAPPDSLTFVHPANAQFLLNTVTWLLNTNPVDLLQAAPDASAAAAETTSGD